MSIQYSSRSQIAVEKIRDDILSGELAAGTKINQHSLAKELGISHIPLREALKQLEGEGYLEIKNYNGVYVKPLYVEEMEDLYRIRAEVEALAARLALDSITGKDLKEMARYLQRMEEATNKRDFKRLLTLNRGFHFTLYQACQRTFLLSLLEDLWNRSSRYRILGTFHSRRADEALREHRKILETAQEGDKEKLEEAILTNIEKTRDYLLERGNFDRLEIVS